MLSEMTQHSSWPTSNMSSTHTLLSDPTRWTPINPMSCADFYGCLYVCITGQMLLPPNASEHHWLRHPPPPSSMRVTTHVRSLTERR